MSACLQNLFWIVTVMLGQFSATDLNTRCCKEFYTISMSKMQIIGAFGFKIAPDLARSAFLEAITVIYATNTRYFITPPFAYSAKDHAMKMHWRPNISTFYLQNEVPMAKDLSFFFFNNFRFCWIQLYTRVRLAYHDLLSVGLRNWRKLRLEELPSPICICPESSTFFSCCG